MSFDIPALSQIDPQWLSQATAFVQVVFIDIVMAGDNALAVGIAASGLPVDKRRTAIIYGLLGAVAIRVAFVLLTVQLLKVVGLLFAGGLLLLWVCMRMWRELRKDAETKRAEAQIEKATGVKIPHDEKAAGRARRVTMASAVIQILLADVSMSLDNVLAVTGAAKEHIGVLAFGLLFSIAAMGVAANLIARVLHKYRWIGYAGVLIVLFVAVRMMVEGGIEVWHAEDCDRTLQCVPDTWHRTVHWWHGVFTRLQSAQA